LRKLFEAAHGRDGSGYYIVRLPVKEEMLPGLCESRNGAMRIFKQRLGRNMALRGTFILKPTLNL